MSDIIEPLRLFLHPNQLKAIPLERWVASYPWAWIYETVPVGESAKLLSRPVK